ncbi:MAG TPA: dihydrofolate reductase family protein [Gaiellales bacterium]|jgi:dihydrofolate reductase|nr:dihydrofolate reductase family protein [Gaiellales bacterium]
MARITLDITMSLDGYIAGPDPSLDDPLGKGGEDLHEWMLRLAAWRSAHGLEGGETGPDAELVEAHIASYGAVVMGRRMFSGGEGGWDDDPMANGWWGDDPPFRAPVFVVTSHPRESLEMRGGTTFHFVTDGIAAALDRAVEAAGDRDVHVAGGADVVQQVLNAGRFDEITVHVAPRMLGSGRRLFDGIDPDRVRLEQVPMPASPAATHLRYRVTPSGRRLPVTRRPAARDAPA